MPLRLCDDEVSPFHLAVNGIAFGLAAALVPGFSVLSALSAIAGVFVRGLVAWVVGAITHRPGR